MARKEKLPHAVGDWVWVLAKVSRIGQEAGQLTDITVELSNGTRNTLVYNADNFCAYEPEGANP